MTERTPGTEAAVAGALEAALGVRVHSLRRVGGGDVAESFAATLADGREVFAKTHADPPPGFFSTEAEGLRWLRETATVAVPEVLAVSDGATPEVDEGDAEKSVPLLVLEWVPTGRRIPDSEARLGQELAAMHRTPWATFGRPDRRTTGSRGLPNEPCDTWSEFYATCRLLPLARLARDTDALPGEVISAMEDLAGRLDAFDAESEPPSLLHGDLWAGNRLVDDRGRSWLIDPAAHGGHREFDLAMMRLFGGFGEECFRAYDEAFPLRPGWRERIDLHQIAPLVVHAIKFGSGYVPAATSAVMRYC